jgi:hypothetical protein
LLFVAKLQKFVFLFVNEALMNAVSLANIRIDGGTQPRTSLYEEIVKEYAETLQEGIEFPPVVLFFDGSNYWLADGFHRFHAYSSANRESIPAEIKKGTRRDAVLYSVGANSAHGLRRTNQDKRQAVQTLLEDDEWGAWSDREIARQCGVSNDFVSRLRRDSLSSNDSQPVQRTYTTRHGTEATMNTSNIGQSTKDQVPVEPDIETEPESNFIQPVETAQPEEPAQPEHQPATKEEEAEAPQQTENKPHVANNSGENEWYTPPEIIESARAVMGSIDLDPASSDLANDFVKAEEYATEEENGLEISWGGNIWLNPPYAQPLISYFIDKLVDSNINQACILTNNGTDTRWGQTLIKHASAVCFIAGRIKFIDKHGYPSGAPLQGQMVCSLGLDAETFVKEFSKHGQCLKGLANEQ